VRCPGCQASLAHQNAAGEPLLRMRGLVLKAQGVVAMCPACRGDVPVQGEVARILSARLAGASFSAPSSRASELSCEPGR
jgi:Zn-finger nucleic acid-binding protein